MKNIIFTLSLLLTFFTSAQNTVNLSNMTSDVTLGNNCGQAQDVIQYITIGDVDLGDENKLRLKNVELIVTGDIRGEGEIVTCGNSTFCVQGIIHGEGDEDDYLQNCGDDNEVEYDEDDLVDCSSLSVSKFNLRDYYSFDKQSKTMKIRDAKFIRIYDLTGKTLKGVEHDSISLNGINDSIILVMYNVDGYTGSFKLLNN